MTKGWTLKTNPANTFLVLVTVLLLKTEWAKGENEPWDSTNSIEGEEPGVEMYVGNDEIADYFFRPSVSNGSLILEGINKCLDSFQMMTCVKMLLLNRINDVVGVLEEPDVANRDLEFLRGALSFKVKNGTEASGVGEKNEGLSLDEEIAVKLLRIFRNRSLVVNLLPRVKIEIEPVRTNMREEFVCFSYTIRKERESTEEVPEGRKKKKGGGMSMMMMVPQMIMLGLMPFTLASLKAMVMNAVMINMMALNGAIFMTIRNLVFGPRSGDNVKYVNYGYSKDRQTQSKKPVLIIHSPAAFVKQPKVHKKPVLRHPAKTHHLHETHFSASSYLDHGQNSGHPEGYGDYYIIEEDGSNDVSYHGQHNRRGQTMERRHEQGNNFRTSFNATRRINGDYNAYQRTQTRRENQKISHNYPRGGSLGHRPKAEASQEPSSNKDDWGTYGSTARPRPLAPERRGPEFRASPQWDPVTLEKS